MPLPTGYTENALADYMITRLGSMADILDWSSASLQVREAVTSVLINWGGSTDSLATVSDVLKVRCIAAVAIWQAALESLAARYDQTSGQFGYDRSQMHEMASKALANAQAEAAAAGVMIGYEIGRTTINRLEDPYARDPAGFTAVEF